MDADKKNNNQVDVWIHHLFFSKHLFYNINKYIRKISF